MKKTVKKQRKKQAGQKKSAKTKKTSAQAKSKKLKQNQPQNQRSKVRQNKQKQKQIEYKVVFSTPSYPITEAKRKKLIEEYTPLIRFIAKKISVRLPANIDVEDLVSNGVIGLMDAIDKYDQTRDNKFKTYAEFRIRGAILDGLRAQDWVPRSVRDKAKMLERSLVLLESELGRTPTDKETAEHLGLSKKEFYNLLNQVQPLNILSIDSTNAFNQLDRKSFLHLLQEASDPFAYLNIKSVKTEIKKMIAALPERQRIVLSLYYYEGFNLRKIGAILGVTESRVSQLHAQAIQRLKVKLEQAFKEHELKVA